MTTSIEEKLLLGEVKPGVDPARVRVTCLLRKADKGCASLVFSADFGDGIVKSEIATALLHEGQSVSLIGLDFKLSAT